MTVTETMEWLGRELTDNEVKYFDFLVPVARQRQNDRILVGYAFVECPVEFLDTPIPQPALDMVYGVSADEEGNETHRVTEKVLKDFTLQTAMSLDCTKAIVLLGAREFEVGRMEAVNADDLASWEAYLTPYGFDSSKWLSREQALALKPGAAYMEAGE